MQNKRKAIIGGLAASAVSAAVVMTGASSAFFFDLEQHKGNEINAGTLDLMTLVDGSYKEPITIKDMQPGDSKTFTVTVKNEGSVAGDLYADIVKVSDLENGVMEPETGDTDATGELGGLLQVNVAGIGSANIDTVAAQGPWKLATIAGHAPSSSYKVTVSLPEGERGEYNNIMSDSYTFDIDLGLVQAGKPVGASLR